MATAQHKAPKDEQRNEKQTKDNDDSEVQAGLDSIQSTFDEAAEKGHFGERLDPTPLENYTLPGVLAGKPTPETDADAAAEATKVTDKRGAVSE